MFRSDLLAGKRILITGGGTGLGKSIGLRYVALGAQLVICGRRKDVLEATAQEFKDSLGATIETHVCDVRDAHAVEAMMDAIWQNGPLDVLLNNAGIGLDKLKFGSIDYAYFRKMYEVNINADPESFLHWDKPLGEQSPEVKAALEKAGVLQDSVTVFASDNGAPQAPNVTYRNFPLYGFKASASFILNPSILL